MKKPKPPKLVTVAIFTTITVVFWIFFEVYETLTRPASVNISEDLLSPLNPALDTEALRELEGRIHIEESEVADVELTVITPVPSTGGETVIETEEALDAEVLENETPTPVPSLSVAE